MEEKTHNILHEMNILTFDDLCDHNMVVISLF